MIRRPFLVLALFLLAFGGAVACSSTPDKPDEALTQDEARVPAFFENIPANSPYVFTSLEPFPMEMLDSYMSAYGEMYQALEKQMKQAGGSAYGPNMSADEKFMVALYEELSAVDSVEDMKKLGMSTRPNAAIYGLGWFPVMRFTLSDAERFEGVLSRMETKAGLQVQMRSLGEQTYRQYNLGDEARAALVITADEAIIGLAPTSMFDETVAYMVGTKKPARSMADVDVMQDIQAKYGYKPYAVGYVDIAGIASTAMGAAAPDELTKKMLEATKHQPPEMTEVCRREYTSIFEKMPRAVFGYTELSSKLMEMEFVLETEGDFASQLAATAAPMPLYGTEQVENSFGAVGMGVDMQKLLGFVTAQADKITRDPFQCEDFQMVNQYAQQARAMSQMVPPFLLSIKGAIGVLRDFEYDRQQFQPGEIEGLLLIDTTAPMTLFAQLKQFYAPLQNVSLQPNGVPAALGPIKDAPWAKVPHVAMNENTIGASVGVGVQDDMAVMLEKDAAGDEASPLFLFAVDYGRMLEEVSAGMRMMAGPGAPQAGINDMFDTLQRMFGPMIIELDASENGLIMRWHMHTFPERDGTSK